MSASAIVAAAALVTATLVVGLAHRTHRGRSPAPWLAALVTLGLYVALVWAISLIDSVPTAGEAASRFRRGVIGLGEYERLRDQAVIRALIHHAAGAAIALGIGLAARSARAPEELPEARATEND